MKAILDDMDDRVYLSYGWSAYNGINADMEKLELQESKKSLRADIKKYHEMIMTIRKIIKANYKSMLKESCFFMICNSNGYVLDIIYDRRIKGYIDSINLAKGVSLAETSCGTNAVSLSVKYGLAAMVTGEKNYWKPLRQWQMICTPILDHADNTELYLSVAAPVDSFLNTDILIAIKTAVENHGHEDILTPIEKQVISFIIKGSPREELCNDLYQSNSTIKRHLGTIKVKLSVKTTIDAVIKTIQLGYIDSFGNILR